MFIVFNREGRNLIGQAPNRSQERVNQVANSPSTTFDEKLREEGVDITAYDSARHQRNFQALNQYKQQLASANERHVVVQVKEIMSSPVLAMTPDASLRDVWNEMQNRGIQHIPVVQNGVLAGIVSLQALLRQVILNDQNLIVRSSGANLGDIATEEVLTTTPNTDIRQVAFMMTQYRIGSLPVLDEQGEMVGIITRSDLIKRLAKTPPLTIYA